ncbi:MAG: aldo/keto reductase [Firmicutes bacterium]|jgi:diketogulonate reductase-like aldo/keto reductase|nr:aldo/keto reductase [Bacillota bacterium]
MTAKHLSDTVTLHNGVAMPWFGLGVWRTPEGQVVEDSVRYALEAGYRHIDTAALYANEVGVGNAIRASGIPRNEIFVTSKVWNSDQGYDQTLKAFDATQEKLKLGTLDLYLIHWPVAGKYQETWRALERIYEEGRVRAIGVSNFQGHHIDTLLAEANVVPMVNQVELHPLLRQTELAEYCRSHHIQIEAWSPLMQGHLDQPVITTLAQKYQKTAAQIVLRWDLQRQIVTIPKSVHQDRIIENAQVFDFELDDEDMQAIDDMNRDQRFGPDPDHFDF